MTPAEAAEAAEAIDAIVNARVDRGVIAYEDLPPALARSLGRRRVLLQKLGMVRPVADAEARA